MIDFNATTLKYIFLQFFWVCPQASYTIKLTNI